MHNVTIVFLQRGMFQLDIKSMTPSNDPYHLRASTGSSVESHSRTSSCTEANISRSPIKKVSQGDNKIRPSQQKSEKFLSLRGNTSENLQAACSGVGSGTVSQSRKDNAILKSPKSSPSPSVFSKKTKPSTTQGAKKFGPINEEDTTNDLRTNHVDSELPSGLPSVAKMVSMIEGRGVPPPVPTSARPKLKGIAAGGNIQLPADQTTTTVTSSDSSSSKVEKKPYPTITGNSALAKPIPLTSLYPDTAKSTTVESPEKLQGSKDSAKESEPSKKHKRLESQRAESLILLSSHSRSQNLWNARLQNSNSVRLLSGPHFTFNVV